jgi:hypothetical protein
MAVDGSSAPVTFRVGPIGTVIEFDITRITGYLQDGSAMDDSLFGGITALTKGCVFRLSNGEKTNMWNAKSNGDLALLTGIDFTYTDSAPSGSFGARFRISYSGQDKHGVTLRMEVGETLDFIIQDDLTGLEVFNLMATGHAVNP